MGGDAAMGSAGEGDAGGAEMLVSYHITSHANWEKIRVEGMVPYPIDGPGVAEMMRRHLGHNWGIWAWADIPRGISLLGCVMDRVGHKHTGEVVLLRLECDPAERFVVPDPDPLVTYRFSHRGSFHHPRNPEAWVYHEREQYRILTNPIPPGRIALLADWDLPRMLEDAIDPEGRFGVRRDGGITTISRETTVAALVALAHDRETGDR
jgi:hypothetical protein